MMLLSSKFTKVFPLMNTFWLRLGGSHIACGWVSRNGLVSMSKYVQSLNVLFCRMKSSNDEKKRKL